VSTPPKARERHREAPAPKAAPHAQERFEDELIMSLERDQFVAATSQPVARAALSARTTTALWALRVFVVLVSLMVIYTFVDQLH
jgi:hypothetical protein